MAEPLSDVAEWRAKYRTAIDKLESDSKAWRQLEDVLRRLVRRLCIAARGADSHLDDELKVVAGAVGTGSTADALEELLARLTTAVTAVDASRAGVGTRTVIGTVTGTGTGSTTGSGTGTGNDTATTTATHAGARDRPEGPVSAATAGLEGLSEPLLLILDRLGLVETEKALVAQVRSELSEPASQPAFEQAVWRLGDLAAAERRRLEAECAESERVLKQVISRLGEIASLLSASDAELGEADRSGLELSERLRDEVQEIGSTVSGATNLGDLQLAVKSRLEAVDTHLQAVRAREERRARLYRERALRMGERIQQLENETVGLERSLRREQRLALLDALTGVANRLGYDERIEQEFKRWRRFHQPLVLLAWDLDHFKNVNDSFGHRAGDRVLRAFAQLLRANVRETDFVARYGGEEFVVLLLGTPAADALTVAETMREDVGRLGFHFRGTPVTVTASCGLTEIRDGDTPAALFDRADRALYRAKESGRNRSLVA